MNLHALWTLTDQEQPETQACRFVEAEPPETEARASFIPSLGDCDGSMDEPGAEVSACCNLKGEVSYISRHFME